MKIQASKATLYEVLIELDSYKKAILTDFNSLNLNQLHFRPLKNDWSLLQIIEHILMSEMASLNYVSKKLLDKDALKKDSPLAALRSYLLFFLMKSPFKFKVNKKVKIVPSDRPKLADIELKWEIARKSMKNTIDNNTEETLDKLIWKHPVAGRFNYHQMLKFCLVHLKRHFNQIKEVKNHPAYPVSKKIEKYEELLQLDKVAIKTEQPKSSGIGGFFSRVEQAEK